MHHMKAVRRTEGLSSLSFKVHLIITMNLNSNRKEVINLILLTTLCNRVTSQSYIKLHGLQGKKINKGNFNNYKFLQIFHKKSACCRGALFLIS